MLAEAAHSAADSVNEVFLAVGLHRARQPADAKHPLGHGRERFLWAFMAAIASFLIGGCLSIAMAIAELKARHPVTGRIASHWATARSHSLRPGASVRGFPGGAVASSAAIGEVARNHQGGPGDRG